MSPDFANGAITGAFAYAAQTCASGGCGESDSPTNAGSTDSSGQGWIKGSAGAFNYTIGPPPNSLGEWGAGIRLFYTGSATNLDWLQTYSAESSAQTGNDNGVWQIDTGGGIGPFYPTEYSSGPNFMDAPSWGGNRIFEAETSLLSQNANGSYSVLGTVKWGYIYSGGGAYGTAESLTGNYTTSNAKNFADFGGAFAEGGWIGGIGGGGGQAGFVGANSVRGHTNSLGEAMGLSVYGGASYTDIGPTLNLDRLLRCN